MGIKRMEKNDNKSDASNLSKNVARTPQEFVDFQEHGGNPGQQQGSGEDDQNFDGQGTAIPEGNQNPNFGPNTDVEGPAPTNDGSVGSGNSPPQTNDTELDPLVGQPTGNEQPLPTKGGDPNPGGDPHAGTGENPGMGDQQEGNVQNQNYYQDLVIDIVEAGNIEFEWTEDENHGNMKHKFVVTGTT